MMNRIYLLLFTLLMGFQAHVHGQYYDVSWTNIVNATYNPVTKVLSNTGTSNWGTSGASSTNQIAASSNGTIKYVIANLTDVQFGFSNVDIDQNPNTIPFSFRIEGNRIYIFQSGSYIGTYGTAGVGLTLEISRSGSMIYYKINGSTVHGTSANPAQVLIGDASLKNASSALGLVQMTVQAPAPPPPPANPFTEYFHPVSPKLDGAVYILPSNGTLRVSFSDKYAVDNVLKWKIYSKSPMDAEYSYDDGSSGTMSRKLGDNRLEFAALNPFLISNVIYVFEITGDKGKKEYLRFKKP